MNTRIYVYVRIQQDPVKFTLSCDYKPFKLISKSIHNHNTIILKISLESPNTKLGLPVGKHILIKHDSKKASKHNINRPITRAYTPISHPNTQGHVELLIKVYENGNMTQYLNSLSINDNILMAGPLGNVYYSKPGCIMDEYIGNEISNIKHIGMIAGGTGITPMYQIIMKILTNKKNDKTKITLLFANHSIKDVLLRKELEKFANENKDQFKLHLIVSSIDDCENNDDDEESKFVVQEWLKNDYKIGRIDKNMIEKYMPQPGNDCVIAVCGQKRMVHQFTTYTLPQIGHDRYKILRF